MKYYRAPWSATLIAVSTGVTLFCVGLSLFLSRMVAVQIHAPATTIAAVLPVGTIVVSALFTILGYTITPDSILVHRLLWKTRLPRAGLNAVRFEPNAMRGSLRMAGNGGLFSFSGLYRSASLGAYRAFATDLQRTVVLQYSDQTIVLTPDRPDAFVRDLMS